MYCFRPAASRPQAWIFRFDVGAMWTCVQPGGIASRSIRSSPASQVSSYPSTFT